MQNWRNDDDEKEKEEKKEKDEAPLAKEIAESFIKQRKVFLCTAVDDESSERIIKQFLDLDSKSHD